MQRSSAPARAWFSEGAPAVQPCAPSSEMAKVLLLLGFLGETFTVRVSRQDGD